jgi:hypothetical protein
MEGHAEMDMSVAMRDASVVQRVRSPEGFTATAGYFVITSESGTHAASAPAISRPPTMSFLDD